MVLLNFVKPTKGISISFAKKSAEEMNCVVAITGKIDLVADAKSCYVIRNGRAEMGKITGTGCQLSGMCGEDE